MSEPFEPKIVAFVCTYCTYAGADLAGTSRLKYAPNVRIVRLPCTGRISPMFILKALQKGADAVLVSGCHLATAISLQATTMPAVAGRSSAPCSHSPAFPKSVSDFRGSAPPRGPSSPN